MREILFRGKSGDGWAEGYYIDTGARTLIQHIPNMTPFDVIPETVGQYTGLTDKNGKKIFEGDILKCVDEHNGIEFIAVVEFGNPNGEYNWGYQLHRIKGDNANTDILLWVETEVDGVYSEVIGNIHDNPELLDEVRE